MKTIEEVKNYIKTADEYKFLKDNERLGDRIILLTLGGSLSYGTERHDENGELLSDIDVRGITMPAIDEVFGTHEFEIFENSETDTVIYEFRKLISLISNCNPNTIELLGSVERNSIYVSPIGQKLIDNYPIFMSNIASKSFGGYASAQLDRLRNAVARDAYEQVELEEHIKRSIERQMLSFNSRYAGFDDSSIRIYTDKAVNPEMETEIFMDANLKHYPLRDYKSMWAEMQAVVKDYAKMNHRSRKKDLLHLCKHSMHLVRLYLMGIDLFETGKIVTYREKDLNLLHSIRNGVYMNEDGTVKQEFFDLVEELSHRFDVAIEHSVLPKKPDYEAINKFMVETLEEYFYGGRNK